MPDGRSQEVAAVECWYGAIDGHVEALLLLMMKTQVTFSLSITPAVDRESGTKVIMYQAEPGIQNQQ